MSVQGSVLYRIQRFNGTEDELQTLIESLILEAQSIGKDLTNLRSALIHCGYFVQIRTKDGIPCLEVSKKPIKKAVRELRAFIHENPDTTCTHEMTSRLIFYLLQALNTAFIVEMIQLGKLRNKVMVFNLQHTAVAQEAGV